MTTGVYKMIFPSGEYYLGSTADFPRRKAEHLARLVRGAHTNRRVQNAYNAHGTLFWDFMTCGSLEEAREREANLIHSAWGSPYLCNLNDPMDLGAHLRGTTRPQEICERISIALKNSPLVGGRPMPEEQRQKIADAAKKRTHSDETRSKISASLKGHPSLAGRTITEETKRKMSEAQVGQKVDIDGVVYHSTSEAARQLNMPRVTVLYRCRSAIFPTWKLI